MSVAAGIFILACLFHRTPALFAQTPDKSGTKPSVISLPKGAGSIEGLGESFQPQLNTGSSSYGVSIAVPPGRAGLQPKVHLGYNSNLGNSFMGLGWSFEVPCIRRQTDKGFPSYTAGDTFLFGGEELVPLSNPDHDWRCENETGFERLRQIDTNGDSVPDAWEVTDRDGVRHIYGQYRGAANRWSVVAHPNPPGAAASDFDKTYLWALDTTIDLHGNRVEYEYTRGPGVLYPSRITYSQLNGNYHEIRFVYEGRSDVFEDYRATFSVTTDQRLRRIEVYSWYDGSSHLVRAYNLEYAYRPEDGITTALGTLDLGVSTLKRVVQLDRSGGTNNFLPPLVFEYSSLNLDAAQLKSLATLPDLDIGEGGGNVQLVDVDGDGLPDIFKTVNSLTTEQMVCLNRGEVFNSATGTTDLRFGSAVMMTNWSSFLLSESNAALVDISGKGLVDFVRLSDDLTGKQLQIFRNLSSLDRVDAAARGFSTQPETVFGGPYQIGFGSGGVRQMDVNFDKRSDFISNEAGFIGDFTYVYLDRATNWVQVGPVPFNADMIGYDLVFQWSNGEENPAVRLVDMNGDRLLDLVYLQVYGSGVDATLIVHYWPYSGLGQWGAEHVMTLSPGDNFQVDTLDLHNVLVEDLTGDGLADIAILRSGGGGDSSLELRVNVAGAVWSPPYTKTGLPRYLPHDPFSPTTFRQADLNGNGSTDLIWRNQEFGEDSFSWLELLPNGKPNLLTRIDNNLGKVTEISYGTATEDLVRAREAGYPWRTKCPMPVQVVRRIRTSCGLDLDGLTDSGSFSTDQYVSEFSYRDAYYDAFEREFRGFSFAQRTDYGDDFLLDTNTLAMVSAPGWEPSRTPTGQVSGPTLVTRFRYHTGAPDGVDNDEYPTNSTGPRLIDEITPLGGHEEEVLKGHQLLEETVDPWVLHDASGAGDFDRGAFLAMTSTNTPDRLRITPDDYVYTRARQEWTLRRLYRPMEAIAYQADQDADGVMEAYPPAVMSPPGRFSAGSPAVSVLDGSGHSVSFAFASKVEVEHIEANGVLHLALAYPLRSPVVTLDQYDFDDYGNQTRHQDYGISSDSSVDDERFTLTDYALQGEALDRWIIGKPSRIRVTDEHGVFVSETRNYYDGSPYVGLSLNSLGSRALLHRAEQVVTDAAALPPLTAQSDQPGDPRLPGGTTVQTHRSSYDTYGNTLIALDPLGSPGSPSSGHARQIAYDPTFQTYPITETILLGGSSNLVISATYDLGFGVITSSTDFNQNLTSYEYDSFARLVAITKPYDSSGFPTLLFQYSPADPNRSRVYDYDRTGSLTLGSSGSFRASNRVITRAREFAGAAGTFVTVSYTDGCGRKLAEASEGDTSGRWIVSKATGYNRRMAAQSEWLPYEISSGSSDTSPPHFGELWPTGRPPTTSLNGDPTVKSDHRHDPTGREIITINPPETIAAVGDDSARTRSVTQFLPLEKRLFDENDNDPNSPYHDTPMIQFSDGLGRLIGVHEAVRLNDDGTTGSTVNDWPTQYRYDLNDNLTGITDSQGNQKWFRYDGLKRKLFMNDPDRGTMTYTYDDASNLRETADAKSQHIQYTYDGVNRLLTENYLDGLPLPPWRGSPLLGGEGSGVRASGLTNSIVYHYDTPLSGLPLGDGTTATAQNTRGFLAWVEDLSGEEHTSYDPRGRVNWVVKRLPDPQFLSLSAGGEGRGEVALVSYKSAFTYDSLDRVTTLTYPDNDQVDHQYNPRNLLSRITGGPSGNIISNILYQPSAQLAQIDYGNAVRTTYAYDPRLRLSSLITQHAARNTELINFSYQFDPVSNIKAITDNRPTSAVPAGNPRRNTQLFQYDDLYRITRAQYSFAAPGTTNDNGSLTYRYDRIGNMLAQTSTFTNTDPKNGLPIENLGTMDSGGNLGRTGRLGRTPTDPPGPHALSSIRNTQHATRPYPYDPNGNMMQIDGLTNTWDFKDRLIAVEDPTMRAAYTYDYTDRRIIKRVQKKSPLPGGEGQGEGGISESFTTVYVDKYFEVREHDAPTKYVWNGNTRVARVTGSLSTNQRLQRLRVYPGWNLCSVAVSGPLSTSGGEGQGEVVQAVFRWDPAIGSWQSAIGQTLPAGTVLWLYATTNATLTVTGPYTDPTARPISPGPNFLPSAGLESWDLTAPISHLQSAACWMFDSSAQSWDTYLSPPLPPLDAPRSTHLPPGSAACLRAAETAQLEVPDSALRIRYYHQDHLGSSSVLTDTAGQLVEEIANYPFGYSRHQFQPRGVGENYQFTQKEKDVETQLAYFEARYLVGSLSRFCRVDPLAVAAIERCLKSPQSFSSYAYGHNSPLVILDSTGCEGEKLMPLDDKPQGPTIGPASGNGVPIETQALQDKQMVSTIAKTVKESSKFAQFVLDKSKGFGGQVPMSEIQTMGKVTKGIGLAYDAYKIGDACSSSFKNMSLEKQCAVRATQTVIGKIAEKMWFAGCVALTAPETFGLSTVACYGTGQGVKWVAEDFTQYMSEMTMEKYGEQVYQSEQRNPFSALRKQ